ncbi:MAG: aminotransferase class V-fold PLP-dependent enzyme [Nitrososphaeria archaeon]
MIFDSTSSMPTFQFIEEISHILPYYFINPSGINSLSTKSKEILIKSRNVIANYLGCTNSEVIFTSSSTESNNLAIKGFSFGKKGSIITTDFEHPSILHPLKTLEKQGFTIIHIETDNNGWVEPKTIEKYIQKDTILLTMGALCRETATLRNITEIVKIIKKNNNNIICHFDLWGLYYPDSFIDLKELDMASFDGPYLLGPQGVGFLYVKKGIKLSPLIEGGTQEKGLRAGEENLFGIFALSQAIKFLAEQRKELEAKLRMYDNYIRDNISLFSMSKNGYEVLGLFSYGLQDIEAEMLILSADKYNFFLNYPSPCMANGIKHKIKQKCGFDDVIVFRILPTSSQEEIKQFISILNEISRVKI